MMTIYSIPSVSFGKKIASKRETQPRFSITQLSTSELNPLKIAVKSLHRFSKAEDDTILQQIHMAFSGYLNGYEIQDQVVQHIRKAVRKRPSQAQMIIHLNILACIANLEPQRKEFCLVKEQFGLSLKALKSIEIKHNKGMTLAFKKAVSVIFGMFKELS
jgi:hypothetical protein